MADQTTSATAPETHQSKSLCLSVLESALYDAANMAAIAADMIEELTTRREDFPNIPSYLYCPDEEADKLCFAVFHLKSMMSGLKDKFHELMEFDCEVRS